jgi:hypothetical protein
MKIAFHVVDRGTNEKVSNMRSLHIVGGSFMCRDAKEDGAYILMQIDDSGRKARKMEICREREF